MELFFKELGCCGIGVVVQNDKGQLMGALSKLIPYPLGALEIEAKVAEIGTTFAWELGLRRSFLKETHKLSWLPSITMIWVQSKSSSNCWNKVMGTQVQSMKVFLHS